MLTVTILEFQVQDDIKRVLRRSSMFDNVFADPSTLYCLSISVSVDGV